MDHHKSLDMKYTFSFVCIVNIWNVNCQYIDGLVQEKPNSIANALELHLSSTNPSIYI